MLIAFLQIIIFVVGVALALYIGLWQLFILSGADIVVAIIDAINNNNSDGIIMRIAWDIFKMMIAGIVAWVVMIITVTINTILGEWKN